jgi:predicted TIM-barrel fold metal-dependent hydrolase
LIPLVLVPFWDPEAAAAEIRRTAALGAKTVSFPENPSPLGLPSFHTDFWDPFFDAVQECDMPVSLHFGSSGQTSYVSPDAPYAVTSALLGQNAMGAMTEIVFSKVLLRFPRLKFVLSESGIGWVPYLVERLDQMWHEHRHYQDINFDARPSDVVREHFWSCTITEPFGLSVRDQIGVGNILLESDYPHGDGSWPNTRKRAEKLLADVPDEEARRISELNAIELFHLEGV